MSDAENSSDGFEDLLIKGKERETKKANKALVQLMVNTERELQLEGKDSRMMTAVPTTTTETSATTNA